MLNRQLPAGELSPAEVFLELKAAFAKNIPPREEPEYVRPSWERVAGLPSYIANQSNSTSTGIMKAWEFLSDDLDASLKPNNPDEFNENLNHVLDCLLLFYARHGRHILHMAIADNRLGLLTAIIKRYKELRRTTDPSKWNDTFKNMLDVYTSQELVSARAPSSIQYAGFVGNIQAYDLLLKAGADTQRSKLHPLLFAVFNNKIDFVKTLLGREPTGYFVCPAALNEYNIDARNYSIGNSGNGLLDTALSKDAIPVGGRDQMTALLIERGAEIFAYSHKIISTIVNRKYKEAAIAFIRIEGIDGVLRTKNIYALMNLVGGYEQIGVLTNTEATDPRMLALIFQGIYSQVLTSYWPTTTYSLTIFGHLMEQISSLGPQQRETKKGLIVSGLKQWRAGKPVLSSLDPDPIAQMTEPQKRAWGF